MARVGLAPLVLLTVWLLANAQAQPAPLLQAPAYAEGDFWQYRVEGSLAELLGAGNLTGAFRVEGLVTARVTSVTESEASLNWSGDLSLQGQVTVPLGEGTAEASLSGSVGISHAEQRETPYFLPTGFQESVELDLSITLGFSVPYLATLETTGALPPVAEAPTYPLAGGDQEFTLSSSIASNVTVSFFGMEVRNSSAEEVDSQLRLAVSEGALMEIPQGTFSTVRVEMEALIGFVPGPFLGLLPGSTQVAHFSGEVGNALRFEFLQDGTEIGNASLQSFSHTSSTAPPFWQHPAFLGGLLAIPVAVLLYRYFRERREGL